MAKTISGNCGLEDFKKADKDMIATSNSSYSGDFSFSRTSDYTEYTSEEATQIINTGNSEELRDLSSSYFYSSGFYRRFILYYATFLKYTPLIIPHIKEDKEVNKEKVMKKYYNCLEFYNKLNFEKLCQIFTLKTLVEGAYYGLFRESPNGATLQDLPFEYSRSRFKTIEGVDIVEINVEYFDSIRDKAKRDECLKGYPIEVKKAYNAFKNKGADKWFALAPGVGVHFNLYEERPFMLNILPAIIDFKEYRSIEKQKDKQELKKLLIQKMPITNDGELVFEPEEVAEMHGGAVQMLKKNPEISVLTSFGAVSLEDLQATRQAITNNLEKIEKTIYSEAGVSKQIFSADGNTTIEKSLQNDMALMMFLANSYGVWLSYILNQRFADNKITFSAKILPVSYYNTDDYISKTINMAQYGFSFLVPSIALGINQSEIMSLKKLEIDLLKMDVKLVPLQSSHTQSGKGDKTSASGNGADPENPDDKPNNEKKESEKSDRTIANENSK